MARQDLKNAGNVDSAQLRRVALSFDVDEGLIRTAGGKQQGSSLEDFIRRTEDVGRALEHELGGADALKEWLVAENLSLDGRRPVDFLAEGRIEVLERVEEALKGLQFG